MGRKHCQHKTLGRIQFLDVNHGRSNVKISKSDGGREGEEELLPVFRVLMSLVVEEGNGHSQGAIFNPYKLLT